MPTVHELVQRIGDEIGLSDWLLVDQARIDAFAAATDDRQFIHVDPERAAQTPFGGTIAHGFLTLSLIPTLADRAPGMQPDGVRMGVNYGSDRLRFLTPVRAGARIRARFRLLALDEKRPGQWQQTNEVTVEIEGGDKPALVCHSISQLFI